MVWPRPRSGSWWLRTLSVLVFTFSFTGLSYLMWSSRGKHYTNAPDHASWARTTVPHNIYDHVYFSSYDGKSVYTNRGMTGGGTKRDPIKLEKVMFDQITDEVIKFLVNQRRYTFKKENCKDIRYREVTTVGLEVDVVCSSLVAPHAERVMVLYPFQPSQVTLHTQVSKTQRINIIVPLKGRPKTFNLFLNNLRKVMTGGNIQLGLTVICFSDNYTQENRLALEAAKDIRGLQTDFIVLEQKSFSRSKALKVGVEKSKVEAAVVFLCDVDVLFTRDFLLRCLATPIQGHQVFFPIVFSQYNPELVFSLHGKKVPPPLTTLAIDDHRGFWRLWGHGMVCLYKSDFLKIKGFNSQKNGWGGEDLKFLEKTSKMKYNIIRSLDYGLFHYYHPKNCTEAGKGMKSACRRLQAMSEASGMNFGFWFFRKKYNSSVWGILKEEEEWERRVGEEWEETTQEIISDPAKVPVSTESYQLVTEIPQEGVTFHIGLMTSLLLNVFLSICLCCNCVLNPRPRY